MIDQNESKYGKLLHADFDQEESDTRSDLYSKELFIFTSLLGLCLIIIITAILTGNLAFLLLILIISPLVVIGWYGYVTQKRALYTNVLLFERAIILFDNNEKKELLRYDISDIVIVFINSQANNIGIVIKTNTQRILRWLDRRRIFNEPHFIAALKSLGVKVEIDIKRSILRELLLGNEN
jgi:hypothetical protein